MSLYASLNGLYRRQAAGEPYPDRMQAAVLMAARDKLGAACAFLHERLEIGEDCSSFG